MCGKIDERVKLLREVMEPYFTKEHIDNFINVCKDLFKPSKYKKASERYNILYNNINKEKSNYIYNIKYYTNVTPFSLKEYKMNKREQEFFDRKLKAAVTDEERNKVITAVVKRCIPEVIENLEKEREKEFKRSLYNVNTIFGL